MTIYRIHISLLDTEPLIWRRVELSSETTLKQLHRILQIVMGWENAHLHVFEAAKQQYGVLDRDNPFDKTLPEGRFAIADVLPRKSAKLYYCYDLGDSWDHLIKLEAIAEPAANALYPRVLDGARSGPPEDSGGAFGYANLLSVLSDPNDPDHQEMSDWVGDNFNPTSFSPEDINNRLRRNRSLAVQQTL